MTQFVPFFNTCVQYVNINCIVLREYEKEGRVQCWIELKVLEQYKKFGAKIRI